MALIIANSWIPQNGMLRMIAFECTRNSASRVVASYPLLLPILIFESDGCTYVYDPARDEITTPPSSRELSRTDPVLDGILGSHCRFYARPKAEFFIAKSLIADAQRSFTNP